MNDEETVFQRTPRVIYHGRTLKGIAIPCSRCCTSVSFMTFSLILHTLIILDRTQLAQDPSKLHLHKQKSWLTAAAFTDLPLSICGS